MAATKLRRAGAGNGVKNWEHAATTGQKGGKPHGPNRGQPVVSHSQPPDLAENSLCHDPQKSECEKWALLSGSLIHQHQHGCLLHVLDHILELAFLCTRRRWEVIRGSGADAY